MAARRKTKKAPARKAAKKSSVKSPSKRATPHTGSTAKPTKKQAKSVQDQPLVLALPRGRIKDEAIELLEKAGYDMGAVTAAKKSRLLIIPVPKENMTVLIVRDADVPSYVEAGPRTLVSPGAMCLKSKTAICTNPLTWGSASAA